MLFPIIVFLMVLSPLFIPVGVTVAGGFDDWRSQRAARPVRQFRPAVGLLPVPA
jgi:hypothetical protein